MANTKLTSCFVGAFCGGGGENFVLFGDFCLTIFLICFDFFFLVYRGKERKRNMKLGEYGSRKDLGGVGEEENIKLLYEMFMKKHCIENE